MLLKVFPMLCTSPVTSTVQGSLLCVMNSMLVRMERNDSDTGDLGLLTTKSGSLSAA